MFPKEVAELVQRFSADAASYRSASYNETQVRREFIDVFLQGLGWDVGNASGQHNRLKEVIHEDALRIGGNVKAPDYAIRVAGKRKFFVEAKKPAVNIRHGTSPAYQLRRYAWSAKLPLSVLTDFEEFALYDCRVQPNAGDHAATARLWYVTYEEYEQRWPEIYALLSREAVLAGSLEAFAEENKAPRGSVAVDSAFLREIEGWREGLAKDIYANNKKISARELNAAVQLTIDRIIFLRMAEDRGIEPYGALQKISNGPGVYEKLGRSFLAADSRYNSGLFHFDPTDGASESADNFTLNLKISDAALIGIFQGLYYPSSPYEFSVLAPDTLGQVYEQFLGKSILLESGRAVVEEKPAVRKAGGVYYTPEYIVRYIVGQTLSPLLVGRSPTQISGADNKSNPIRVVDPACGSGSFLIEAYQYLLDWYREAYMTGGGLRYTKGKEPKLYSDAKGELRLTIAERRRILISHIFGVDVDPQAVEVSKLSLLLKVLEGESGDTVASQMDMFRVRALPDLSSNIKCGNSLIGSDYFKGKPASLFNDDDLFRINSFDWTEFEFVEKEGGFSAVIGNPPWVSLSGKFGNDIHNAKEQEYLISKFNGNTYMPNMYEYFITCGLRLMSDGGRFSFIVPDRFGMNDQFIPQREAILRDYTLEEVSFRAPFPKVTADTLIFRIENRRPKKTHKTMLGEFAAQATAVAQAALQNASNRFRFEDPATRVLAASLDRLEKAGRTRPLGDLFRTTSGFGGKSKLISRVRTSPTQIEVLKGENITKYATGRPMYFDFRKENITGRTTDREKLGWRPKVLIRKTGANIIASFDDGEAFPEQSLYFTFGSSELDPFYLLGLLNSRMLGYLFNKSMLTNEASIAQIKKVDLDRLPVVVPGPSGRSADIVGEIAANARSIKSDLEEVSNTSLEQKRSILRRRIKAAEGEIDNLVYELYDLSAAEVAEVKAWTQHLSLNL